jgi:hypothetical protein
LKHRPRQAVVPLSLGKREVSRCIGPHTNSGPRGNNPDVNRKAALARGCASTRSGEAARIPAATKIHRMFVRRDAMAWRALLISSPPVREGTWLSSGG